MATNNIFGILSNYNINDNLPAVLDAIRWKETGGEPNPLKAIGSSGEIGAFQLNPEHFSDFGFDVQKNITSSQAQDYWSSKKIASDLLEGMKKYRNYDLGQLLASYNWGSGNVDDWISKGGKFEDLPNQTQDYLTKVAQKLQEGYVDPLRTSMMPQPKPRTMMASYNDQGINQNFNNDMGQVDTIYRGDAQIHDSEPLFKRFQNNGSKEGNIATMAVQDFQPKLNIPYLEQQKNQGFQEFPYLNTSPTIAEMQSPENGWYRDEKGLLKNKFAEDFERQKLLQEQMAQGKQGGAFNKGSLLQNMLGIGTANANELNNQTPMNQAILDNSFVKKGNNQTRQNSPLATPSNNDYQIGLNETLFRMAGAGLSNMNRGSTASLGSAINTFGEIQDVNRTNLVEMAKAQAEALKNKKDNEDDLPQFASGYTKTVFNTLDDIDKIMDEGWFDSGLMGAITQYIPQTSAYNLQAKMSTLRSSIGFDKLQDMRDKSPTGGALGQVSERELTQLNASLGSLDIGQSPAQLKQNLQDIRRHYTDTVKALKAEYDFAGVPFPLDVDNLGRGGNTNTGGNSEKIKKAMEIINEQ